MSALSSTDKSSYSIEQAPRSADQSIRATRQGATGAVDIAKVNHFKVEPVEMVLIAAATGAAIMALVSLLAS